MRCAAARSTSWSTPPASICASRSARRDAARLGPARSRCNLAAPFFLAQALAPAMTRARLGPHHQHRVAAVDRAPSPTARRTARRKGGIVQLTRAIAQAWSRTASPATRSRPGFFPTAADRAGVRRPGALRRCCAADRHRPQRRARGPARRDGVPRQRRVGLRHRPDAVWSTAASRRAERAFVERAHESARLHRTRTRCTYRSEPEPALERRRGRAADRRRRHLRLRHARLSRPRSAARSPPLCSATNSPARVRRRARCGATPRHRQPADHLRRAATTACRAATTSARTARWSA